MTSRMTCHEYLSPFHLLLGSFPRASSRMSIKWLVWIDVCSNLFLFEAIWVAIDLFWNWWLDCVWRFCICLQEADYIFPEWEIGWFLMSTSICVFVFLDGLVDTFPRITNRMICYEYCILWISYWFNRCSWSWSGCRRQMSLARVVMFGTRFCFGTREKNCCLIFC